MEQVAIITKLVQELIALNKPIDVESMLGEFVSSLEQKVKVSLEEKAKLDKYYREEARKKEAQRERRRELYQLKKAEKKAKEVDWRSNICKFCGGYNGGEWCVSCFGEKK
jgi:hypothetical protein